MARTAVILFNLGGPDCPEAIRPFLYNLFRDPAIIPLPNGIRQCVAWTIARSRVKTATAIYAEMGGRSPILPETEAQAAALEAVLQDVLPGAVKVFIAMRYWKPFADETVALVRAWEADRIVLLPLYPQYSTTTTGSSVEDWAKRTAAQGLTLPTFLVQDYPDQPGMIAAQSALLQDSIRNIGALPYRVLFSAHGLPESVIAGGDPYRDQVEITANAIAVHAGLRDDQWRVTFQSRVGPKKWIEPYTDREIVNAGRDGLALAVLPIAFVSEHSETLVELDVEYRHLATQSGVPNYQRVPAVGTHPSFIAGLSELVLEQLGHRHKDLPHV